MICGCCRSDHDLRDPDEVDKEPAEEREGDKDDYPRESL